MGKKNRSTPPAPRRRLSRNGIQEGVCKGCGKKTTYWGRQLRRDSIHWHIRCYQRLYARKRRGRMRSYKKTCVVCGRTFLSQGSGAKLRKTCSQACALRHALERKGRSQRGVKFTKLVTQGVCLGCGGTTRKGKRRRRGRADSLHWHQLCYHRLRECPKPVREKLIAIHREFAAWLAAWKKKGPA